MCSDGFITYYSPYDLAAVFVFLFKFDKNILLKISKRIRAFLMVAIAAQIIVYSCTTVDLYEKSVTIPGHAWESSFRPSFDFTIKDTNSLYQLFLVLRHNEKYSFSNIYVNVYAKVPGEDTTIKIQKDLQLATNEKGWLATGMDDIYDHRLELGRPQALRAGDYTFTVEQIMRENPLLNVLNVGIRVEKK
jgi:gliding motility-associated lipoprotein GldH